MINKNIHLNIDNDTENYHVQIKNRPFLLKPEGKDYLWGGRRINDEFAKGIELEPLAETWECSTHRDGPSVVASGKHQGELLVEVLRKHPEYLGTRVRKNKEFPLLIKFIDANKDLSVQVHPNDAYAKEYENGGMGKAEMWYVLDADRDAQLIYGLNHDMEKSDVRTCIAEGTLEKHLQRVRVRKGDVFYIEAGVIHAIGAGTLIAEIQENSNLTYRLYDYNRVDKYGKIRELHVDKALDVAKLQKSTEPIQPMRVLKYRPGCALELLCRCEHFEVYRMIVNTERCRQMVQYQTDSVSFRVLLCIDGCGTVLLGKGEYITLFKGDCVFFPANSEVVYLHGRAEFLDIRG